MSHGYLWVESPTILLSALPPLLGWDSKETEDDDENEDGDPSVRAPKILALLLCRERARAP